MNDGAVARDALGMLTSKKPDEIDERVDAAAEEFKAKKSEAMIVQRDHGLLFAFGSPPMSHLLANCRDPRTTGGRVTLVIRIPAAERLTDGCLCCLSSAVRRWPIPATIFENLGLISGNLIENSSQSPQSL